MAFSLHFRLNSSRVPFHQEFADNSLSACTDLHFHMSQNLLFFWIICPYFALENNQVVSFTTVPSGFFLFMQVYPGGRGALNKKDQIL